MRALAKALEKEAERREQIKLREAQRKAYAEKIVNRIHEAFDSYVPSLNNLLLSTAAGNSVNLQGDNPDLKAAGMKMPFGLGLNLRGITDAGLLQLRVEVETDNRSCIVTLSDVNDAKKITKTWSDPASTDPEIMLEAFFSAFAPYLEEVAEFDAKLESHGL